MAEQLKYTPNSINKTKLAESRYGAKQLVSNNTVDRGLSAWQTWNKVTLVGAGIGWIVAPGLAPLWATSMAVDGAQILVIDRVRKKDETKKGRSMNETVIFEPKIKSKVNADKKQFALAA